jgi:hypothetical protein
MRDNYTFQLLAPCPDQFTESFTRSKIDLHVYDQYLASMQRLRGRIYLKDSAIQPWQIDDDGRFRMQHDEQSWHLLLTDGAKEVIGCARYLIHTGDVRYERLRISHSPLARDAKWGHKVREAVEADLSSVRRKGLAYVEAGGWALAEEWRGTRAALEILVGSYALGQLWGGCLGSCTATARHSSSSILRRIGGTSFQWRGVELPAYQDAEYGCTMELLRFDYRSPSERFIPLINQLRTKLAKSTILFGAESEVANPEFLPEALRFLHVTASGFSQPGVPLLSSQ